MIGSCNLQRTKTSIRWLESFELNDNWNETRAQNLGLQRKSHKNSVLWPEVLSRQVKVHLELKGVIWVLDHFSTGPTKLYFASRIQKVKPSKTDCRNGLTALVWSLQQVINWRGPPEVPPFYYMMHISDVGRLRCWIFQEKRLMLPRDIIFPLAMEPYLVLKPCSVKCTTLVMRS